MIRFGGKRWKRDGVVYDVKLAARKEHVSQFPKGGESLEWMMKRDAAHKEVIGVTYAERFKRMEV